MPTNYSSRVIVSLSALFIALFLIFGIPSSRWFDSSLSVIQRTNLKPGIDMVGGVRLIYAIQAQEGADTFDLANKVMEALKRRVDPNGLRNLVWRPQGQTRLEIQMPLSPEAAKAKDYKKAFDDAQKQLESTNITQNAVVTVVETMTGDQRAKALADLARDSETRRKVSLC